MKLLLKLAAIGVGALILLGVAFVLAIDPLVETAITKGGTRATGVPCSVAEVDLGLFAGDLELQGFQVQNPPGFRPEPFLALGAGHVKVETGSLLGDEIRVEEIALERVTVNIERAGGKTNYGVILDNVEKLSGKGAPQEPSEPGGAKKSLRVKRIVVTDVTAGLHLDVPLASGSTTIAIPRIEIDDFSSDGSTTEIVAKLTASLVRAILDATLEAGGGILPKDLLEDLSGNLDEVSKALGEDVRGILDEVQKGGSIEDAAEDAKEALKDLGGIFKKKKD